MSGEGWSSEIGEAEARRLLAECADENLVETLREVIKGHRRGGWLTLKQVSSLSGTSVRSLQRRLAEQGETFASLADDVRVEVATELIENTGLSLAEIAHRLGYSELTNFIRSFKRLTGKTPGQLRGAE